MANVMICTWRGGRTLGGSPGVVRMEVESSLLERVPAVERRKTYYGNEPYLEDLSPEDGSNKTFVVISALFGN